MKPGRRAFFLPGLRANTPWANFCQRVSRAVAGRFDDITVDPSQPGRAVLEVARDEDVYHARALCLEYGVLLVLPGAVPENLPVDRHWLTLTLARFDEVGLFDVRLGTITVQAGCTLGGVRQQILDSGWHWPYGADEQTVGAWLAGAGDWPPGRCDLSGLVWAEVMLATGNFERLGPFGVDSTRALRSTASSKLVSSLFELAGTLDMQAMLAGPVWPCKYRLDAISPLPDPSAGGYGVPNPAHLLLGNEGSLAWVSRVQLQLLTAAQPALRIVSAAPDTARLARSFEYEIADDQIKGLFDPSGIFPRSVV